MECFKTGQAPKGQVKESTSELGTDVAVNVLAARSRANIDTDQTLCILTSTGYISTGTVKFNANHIGSTQITMDQRNIEQPEPPTARCHARHGHPTHPPSPDLSLQTASADLVTLARFYLLRVRPEDRKRVWNAQIIPSVADRVTQ